MKYDGVSPDEGGAGTAHEAGGLRHDDQGCSMMIRPVIIAHSCIINIIIIGDIVRLSDVEIKYALEYLA